MYYLLCLCANLFFSFIAAAQRTGDPGSNGRHYRYHSVSFFTGAAAQFHAKRDGLLSVSFPYKVVDASGDTTSAVFQGQKSGIYNPARYLLTFVAIEEGRRHAFIHLDAYWSFVPWGGWGFQGLIGYGRIWYLGRRDLSQNGPERRYALKFSVNFIGCTEFPADGNYVLGSIDNWNQTIYLLGQEADPTFSKSTSRYGGTQTYNVNTLDICYYQTEWSFMPKVSILPNPYRQHKLFELTIGYNLPVYEYNELSFVQRADEASQSAGTVHLSNRNVSASYNGKPFRPGTFRFQGLYLALNFDFVGSHIK